MNKKDQSIERFVKSLPLRERGWEIVDHWDADLFAIGVAGHKDPRRLVYVSTFKQPPGRYYFECEVPAGAQESEQRTIREGEGVDLQSLLDVMSKHLAPAK